jgi:hypothetical protein
VPRRLVESASELAHLRPAALAAFSVTMAAGRVAGDRLAERFGSVALVRGSGLLAGTGWPPVC